MMHFARLLSLAVAPSTTAFRTRRLGSSQLVVTEACLGTMTYGLQNSEAEAHAQLDLAVDEHGINFLDCAEMYPTPNSAASTPVPPAFHAAPPAFSVRRPSRRARAARR